MVNILDQEDSISLLDSIKIIPDKERIEIYDENGCRNVVRSYEIEIDGDKYMAMNTLTIKYILTQNTEKIKRYIVYLNNGNDDVIIICQSKSHILNTLFNNIILLELSNWRRTSKGLRPIRKITDYNSYMFDIDTPDKKSVNHLKIVAENKPQLLNKFLDYSNSNTIISTELWKKFFA